MSIRTMKEFIYHAPATIQEVMELLDQYGDEANLMLGGTDLIPKMKGHVLMPNRSLQDSSKAERVSSGDPNSSSGGE